VNPAATAKKKLSIADSYYFGNLRIASGEFTKSDQEVALNIYLRHTFLAVDELQMRLFFL
jgi:hypothetical protein